MAKEMIDEPFCVVTGAAGFVGSHLCEHLLGRGCRVAGVDNFFSGRRKNLTAFLEHPRFSFWERSVTEDGLLEEIRNAWGVPHAVFHLAAIVSVPYSLEHPQETMEVNFEATIRLLGDAERFGCRAFVFAGSAAEYGDDDRLPLKEEYATHGTRWLSPYGEAKYRATVAVASAGGSLRGISLRCFNIYGPRQDPSSPYSGVISRFSEQALRREPLTIFGDGHQTRDFVFVSDVVDAYCRASGLFSPRDQGASGIYNVGSGKQTRILDLARLILRLTEQDESIRFYPERPGDIRHSVAAVQSIRRAMGWHPQVELEEGLRRTLRWMQQEAAAADETGSVEI